MLMLPHVRSPQVPKMRNCLQLGINKNTLRRDLETIVPRLGDPKRDSLF